MYISPRWGFSQKLIEAIPAIIKMYQTLNMSQVPSLLIQTTLSTPRDTLKDISLGC